ncbi:MAG: hypothetical protein JWM75_484 [Sphingomonas bacterium]|nr:hypothetical protein [Sphingomonas bacterium]
MHAGGHRWAFDPSLPSWIGIMPRDGAAGDLRWFEAPPGPYQWMADHCFVGVGERHPECPIMRYYIIH